MGRRDGDRIRMKSLIEYRLCDGERAPHSVSKRMERGA